MALLNTLNLKNYGTLNLEDRQKLEELIHWFDHNLPIPEYYQKKKNRQDAKSATSWFKDTSNNFISRMNELSEILKIVNSLIEKKVKNNNENDFLSKDKEFALWHIIYSVKDNGDGTRTDYWVMDLPHAPYLFMMAIGDFSNVK